VCAAFAIAANELRSRRLRIVLSDSLSLGTRHRVSGESASISRSFDTHRLDFLAVLP
jgi:hypothetical protein